MKPFNQIKKYGARVAAGASTVMMTVASYAALTPIDATGVTAQIDRGNGFTENVGMAVLGFIAGVIVFKLVRRVF